MHPWSPEAGGKCQILEVLGQMERDRACGEMKQVCFRLPHTTWVERKKYSVTTGGCQELALVARASHSRYLASVQGIKLNSKRHRIKLIHNVDWLTFSEYMVSIGQVQPEIII